jgi:hypothetical protein
VVIEKILKVFFLFEHMYKRFSLFWAHPTPVDHDLNKHESPLCQEAVNVNLSFSALVVLEKIFK